MDEESGVVLLGGQETSTVPQKGSKTEQEHEPAKSTRVFELSPIELGSKSLSFGVANLLLDGHAAVIVGGNLFDTSPAETGGEPPGPPVSG